MNDDEDIPPTEYQIAQALCLVDCCETGFAACTWDGVSACMDASADHYHEVARARLLRWPETKRV